MRFRAGLWRWRGGGGNRNGAEEGGWWEEGRKERGC